MKYSALIGEPTEHSVSPLMFEWFASHMPNPIEYKHLKIDVHHSSQLKSVVESFTCLGFCGLNVTLPYKLDIIPVLDKIDSSITDIGAVNTITLDNNLSVGYNTDWFGIYKPLKDITAKTDRQTAVVFGTGGAARAAIYACLKLDIDKIIVMHRQTESDRTILLKSQYDKNNSVRFDTYENLYKYIKETNIFINATSAGMVGQDSTPFPVEILVGDQDLSGKFFFDCVFNPVKTPLLAFFESKNATTIDGLWMMIYQGLQAFTLWTGVNIVDSFSKVDLEKLHALLKKNVRHV